MERFIASNATVIGDVTLSERCDDLVSSCFTRGTVIGIK